MSQTKLKKNFALGLVIMVIISLIPRNSKIVFVEAATIGSENKIQYSVKKTGRVSIGIYDSGGILIRQLISGEKKGTGNYTINWDGKDDNGNVVEIGEYQWRGIIVPDDYRIVYDGTIGNKGVPSYSDEDNYTRTEHRSGVWTDVIVDNENNIYSASAQGEGNPLVQKLDSNGNVIWGAKGGSGTTFSTLSWALAVDENSVFMLQPAPLTINGKKQQRWVISKVDRQTGQFKQAGNFINYDSSFSQAQVDDLVINKHQAIHELANAPVRKIKVYAGKLYAPEYYSNRIDIYDAQSLKFLNSINNIDKPQDLAIGSNGNIYVLSNKTIKLYSLTWEMEKTVVDDLDAGWAITLDKEDNIYVVDLGDSQQIKIFSKEGHIMNAIGEKGGWFDYGKIDQNKLTMPAGVAVDDNGNIIVTDYGNDRIQKYDSKGKVMFSLISGAYFDSVFPDEEHPEILWDYGANRFRQYKVNYENKTWNLEKFWNGEFYDFGQFKNFFPYEYLGTNVVRYFNGRPYIITGFRIPKILRVEDNNLIPVASFGGKAKSLFWEDGKGWVEKSMEKPWTWSDFDHDGLIEESELTFYDKDLSDIKLNSAEKGNVDENGTVYLSDLGVSWPSKIVKFPIAGFNKNGDPYFSWNDAKKIWELPKEDWFNTYAAQGCRVDSEGNIYVACVSKDWSTNYTTKNVQSVNILKYDKNNKRLWKVGKKMGAQKDEPGEFGLPTFFPGIIDNLVYVGDVTGQLDVWTEDGLYVATLLEDGNTNPLPTSYYRSNGEQWVGYLFKNKDNGKTYYYTAPNAMCFIRRYEIAGANDIERISGSLGQISNIIPMTTNQPTQVNSSENNDNVQSKVDEKNDISFNNNNNQDVGNKDANMNNKNKIISDQETDKQERISKDASSQTKTGVENANGQKKGASNIKVNNNCRLGQNDKMGIYAAKKEIVECISQGEAEIVFNYNELAPLANNEKALYVKIVNKDDNKKLTIQNKYAIAEFLHEGTQTTKRLGSGERAGVISSYRAAFDKMPATESDWQDVIKIANGRWPAEQNATKEKETQQKIFQKIYKRSPNMANANDNAAVIIITYGLRPVARNTESEKNGIKIFKGIYGYNPTSASDWDVVRAIAYSGATR